MQLFYIKTRDELCRNGEVLLTPALSYTERHLQAALEIERMEKSEAEQREDEDKKKGGESEETPQETAVGVTNLFCILKISFKASFFYFPKYCTKNL